MDNIVFITFKQEKPLMDVLDRFKENPITDEYSVMQAAVLRKMSGKIVRERSFDFGEDEAGTRHLTNDLIDSIVSVMSGPIGSLIGGYTGPLLDAELNARQIVEDSGMLEAIAAKLNENEWALLALVREHNEISLSSRLNTLGASAAVRKDAALVAYEVMNARAIRSEWEERNGAFDIEAADDALKESIRAELRERAKRNSFEQEQSIRDLLNGDFDYLQNKSVTREAQSSTHSVDG
ncbi:hypothetical protein [Saccharibacillus endophyticus]|uniref:Uncharacterized protein n=1 Tax=Saccharibacillus endophyticus TaxID=2060666 RepID=A0ABQ2A1P5_9BACL|nr:hypothetical protein [Saccharibacillus endophyticus]GGH82856.1 hypothetical protein GCM10007362_34810 [Saccharibacillus endophyticus]